MFSAAAVSLRRLITKTFASNENWPVPAGVTRLETAIGYGARGTDSYTSTSYTWQGRVITYYYGRDGQTATSSAGFTLSGDGRAPGEYCDPIVDTPDDPNYYSHQDCYDFIEFSSTQTNPAETGDSATGFGLTFPGSTGNVPVGTTTFSNVAVTPGAYYSVVIPGGGSITITYYL